MSDAVAVAVAGAGAVALDEVEPDEVEQPDTISKLERLILAQAVYELGSDAWTSVASILSQHPLIPKRDNAPFSPSVSPSLHLTLSSNTPFFIQACRSIYHHLLRAVGLDR